MKIHLSDMSKPVTWEGRRAVEERVGKEYKKGSFSLRMGRPFASTAEEVPGQPGVIGLRASSIWQEREGARNEG